MKNNVQSFVIFCSLIIMLFVASACGNQDTGQAEAQAPQEPEAVVADEPTPQEPETPPADEPADEPAEATLFIPGVYTATVPGWNEAPMTVQVTFSEDQITDIELIEHNESKYGQGWALRALPGVPDQILVRQSTMDIDAFTGATTTRNAVIEAVEEAIIEAGADPASLTPQLVDAPLPGDRFIPGYVEITVPAGTMDIYGEPLTEGAVSMLWNPDVDMNLRLSFGRNKFHLHTGGAMGLAQGDGGHGESAYSPDVIRGGTMGGWWFRQMTQHQINDRQSTQGIDIYTGATQSASAIVWGVEQAMIMQGADPATILPRAYPRVKIPPNPAAEPGTPFFEPGRYTVTVEGFGGPMEVRVTFDRSNIRRIEILEHNETESFWDMIWGSEADDILRNAIFEANAANIDDVDVIAGATVSSQAVIDAVRQAMDMAWVR